MTPGERKPGGCVAVLMERMRQPNAWQAWGHALAGVLPSTGADMHAARVLRDDGQVAHTLHTGLRWQLHPDEAEGYHLNLASGAPVWFVMWRVSDDDPASAWPEQVTLSYHEAARWLDAQERVDNVALPPEMRELLHAFAEAHYRPEPKQRRRPASFRAPQER